MWCSYCNSLNTMPLDSIVRLLQNGEHDYAPSLWNTGANDRYYGLNVASVWKHGTLEFRHFPTTTNKEELWSWVDFCHAISLYADEVVAQHVSNSEFNIVEAVLRDAEQPETLLRHIFGNAPAVLEGLTSEEGWQQHISSAAEELGLLLSTDFADTDYDDTPIFDHFRGLDAPSPASSTVGRGGLRAPDEVWVPLDARAAATGLPRTTTTEELFNSPAFQAAYTQAIASTQEDF